jgi:hypothetical protein
MVAQVSRDVRIRALTWGSTVRTVACRRRRSIATYPASNGRRWLMAAVCAQYVPKFQPLRR